MRYLFARHGESTANRDSIISNTANVHPLTEGGVQQAMALAKRLEGEQIRSIYSSPLLRARQTGEIIAQHLDVPLILEDALREFSCGVLEGRGDSEAWAEFVELFQSWLKGEKTDQKMGGGECVQEIAMRFKPFMQRLIAEQQGQRGAIVLVSHGGLLYTMLPEVVDNLDLGFIGERIITNTSLIVTEERHGHLHCIEWCSEQID